MTDSPEIFFQRLSQRIVTLLGVIMLPALLASAIRAVNVDGAYGVVIVQILVFAWIVYLALPLSRTSFAVRTYSLVGIGVVIGAGALIRNPDPGVGMAGLIVASVFLSAVNTGSARYIFIGAVFPAAAVISHFAGQSGWSALISHALAMGGMAAVANMLVGGVVAHAKERVQEEIKLRNERDKALAELAREQARRDLVAGAADIAFLLYDYATGMVDGDLALQRRYGRNADDGALDLSSRFDDFPAESFALIQQKIGEMSQQPTGAEETFVHQQYIGEDRAVSTFRVTGVNIERDGRLLFMGASIDITSEMAALERSGLQAQKLELVATAGGLGLIEFYPDTRTFTCNAEVAQRLGIEPTEAELDIELYYAHQTDEIRKILQTFHIEALKASFGELQRLTHPFILANGELHHLRVTRFKRMHKGRESFLVLSVDITDAVVAREQAQKQADQLKLITDQGKLVFMSLISKRALCMPTLCCVSDMGLIQILG
jgi:PAS domain-containing protein